MNTTAKSKIGLLGKVGAVAAAAAAVMAFTVTAANLRSPCRHGLCLGPDLDQRRNPRSLLCAAW